MSITVEQLKKHLSYEGCNCPVEHKADLGIFNGVCSKHGGKLLVDGKCVETERRRLREKIKAFFGRG